ncbi:MAG: GSCFA domain-containing protein [Bacteroidota bacterium]
MTERFRTAITPTPQQPAITLQQQILALGSCFTDCTSERLIAHKFQALSNPFGTIFNPSSITQLLRHSLAQQVPEANTYLNREGIYYNELLHSDFSAPDQAQLAQQIQAAFTEVSQWLHQSSWLLVTFGTAFIYRRKSTGNIVTNCHQLPTQLFERSLLSVEEIVTDFTALWRQLRAVSPGIRMILTVSPVRHLKDNLAMNSVSKSVLRLACHKLQEELEGVDYFHAYEVLIDDLRDYRFYKADLVHPNEVAESYIWDLFCQSYLDPTTQAFLKGWQKVRKALAHRPRHPHTSSHQKFIQSTLRQLRVLSQQYGIDCSQETQLLKQQAHA